MDSLRVLHILEGLDVGGAELLVLKWSKAFVNQYDIHIIALRPGVLLHEFQNAKVPVFILEKKMAFDLFFLFRLIKIIKQIRPDVINVHNGIPVISYGVTAARLNKIPIVCTIHGRTHYRNIDFKTKIWFKKLRQANKVVTVTKSIASELESLAQLKSGQLQTIYNGIEVKPNEGKSREDYFREFSLSDDSIVVGTVGRLRKIKGHQHLIEALSLVLEHLPNVKLIIVGEGEELTTLKKLAKALGVENHVVFTGLRTDAVSLMKMFNLFVLSSDSEGLPLVILEAISAQVPILSTEVGGINEVIENGKTGVLIPPSNSQLLAKSIIKMLQNYDEFKVYAKDAFEKVLPYFDIEKTHQAYNELYKVMGEVKNES